jgi:hypothetical protein
VVELGLALVRMEQRRHRLEDLFRDGPVAGNEANAVDVARLPPPPPPPAARR